MELFSSIPSVIALCVCVALHIVSSVLSDNVAKILRYVNIGFHIALFLVIFFSKLEMESAALAMMISLFVYTLSYRISEAVRHSAKPIQNGEEEGEG